MHVYQHGLPDLLCEHRGQRAPAEDTIQAAVAEAVDWIATLAITLSARQTDVHLPVLHMLSARLGDLSHGQCEEQRARISSFRQVSDQIANAKRIATDRDSGKRRFDDMCADDQQLIEEFDTGRLQKRSRSTLAQRGSAFRSQLPSASAAAEHAAGKLPLGTIRRWAPPGTAKPPGSVILIDADGGGAQDIRSAAQPKTPPRRPKQTVPVPKDTSVAAVPLASQPVRPPGMPAMMTPGVPGPKCGARFRKVDASKPICMLARVGWA